MSELSNKLLPSRNRLRSFFLALVIDILPALSFIHTILAYEYELKYTGV